MFCIKRCEPSKELYNRVRGSLIAQGTSLSAVCKELQIKPQNAKLALCGIWEGQKGQDCLNAFLQEAQL